MADLIRESPVGQVVRLVTRTRLLKYPEEEPGFRIPWEGIPNQVEAEKLDPQASDDSIPETGTAEQEKDLEAGDLARRSTTHRSQGSPATLTRTKTREQTLPYTAERLQTELEEQAERVKSRVIEPQKTADGIILVDWYTTGTDPPLSCLLNIRSTDS